jgi:arginine deiminase
MDAIVHAEWDRLRTVVLHRPGIEMFFGLLEPYASLYDRAFSQTGALTEHLRLEDILRHEFGVKVILVKDAIKTAADTDPKVREKLVDAARTSLTFTGDQKEVALAWTEFEKNVGVFDPEHFITILLLQPAIRFRVGNGVRNIDLTFTEHQPLSNLYFMRDQQAVTDRGIILGRMAKPQRTREPAVTRLLWDIMGVPISHETAGPGIFEGGDFMPMKTFALIGMGDRTNWAGVEQLLSSGIGFDEVGVVSQPAYPTVKGTVPDAMADMHLDTYFNVASSGVVVGSARLMRQAKLEIFYRNGDTYYKEKGNISLYSFIREKGFDVIDITMLEQMAYAPNFLCIRDGTILSVEVDRTVKKVIATLAVKAELDPGRYGALHAKTLKEYSILKREGQFFPHKKEVYQHGLDAYPIVIEDLTGGFGAAHCMTCVLNRN